MWVLGTSQTDPSRRATSAINHTTEPSSQLKLFFSIYLYLTFLNKNNEIDVSFAQNIKCQGTSTHLYPGTWETKASKFL